MVHAAGGKITRSHTTVTEDAAMVVKAAEKLAEVHKIVLGIIVQGLPAGQPRLKCLAITGGLRVDVRGRSSKQQLYIYTNDTKTTEAVLKKLL